MLLCYYTIIKYQLDMTIWSVRDLVFLLQLMIFALVFSLNNFSREELELDDSVLILLGNFGISKASALLLNLSKAVGDVGIKPSWEEFFPDSCNSSSTDGNIGSDPKIIFFCC